MYIQSSSRLTYLQPSFAIPHITPLVPSPGELHLPLLRNPPAIPLEGNGAELRLMPANISNNPASDSVATATMTNNNHNENTTNTTAAGGLPRSPPKNKNTAHVPCKFFLQGQCQAGRMCPFSHDVESSARPAPCKYFAKGGCKFGRKCALLHVAPDGTVVNRNPQSAFAAPTHNYMMAPSSGLYNQVMPGLLSMQARALDHRQNGDGGTEYDQYVVRNGGEQFYIDHGPASPKYGSSPQELRFGASPSQRGLSVLDAPLPNSFDSNGISLAARNGPFAASVPSRFGLETPATSSPQKSQLRNSALRDLHTSAFGEPGLDTVIASMSSSPPSGNDEPLTFPKRSLYSDRFRASQAIYSASLGARFSQPGFGYSDDDGGEEEEDDGDTDREEDLLPASLRDLIPEGRSRRASRSRIDEESPAAHLAAQRRTISQTGTPQDSKVGSPHSSSPSRFTNMFAARTSVSKNEIGSPLRNSGFSYAQVTSASHHTRPSLSGDLSPTVSSPPRQASMSMLTQELQRTKLDAALAASLSSPQLSPRIPTRSLSSVSLSSASRHHLDRGLSSTSVSKIDEEQELFDMDEVGDRPIGRGIGMARANPGEAIFTLSTSPWNARPFGLAAASGADFASTSVPVGGRSKSSEVLSFGAIGSQRK